MFVCLLASLLRAAEWLLPLKTFSSDPRQDGVEREAKGLMPLLMKLCLFFKSIYIYTFY